MPKVRRAGRKYQLRRIVKTHLVPGYHNSTYLGVCPRHRDSNNRRPAEHSPQPSGYRVIRIEQPSLADLPAGDLPRIPGDPRPAYYTWLREGLIHYQYGGATPTAILPHDFAWPAEFPGIRKLKELIRTALTTPQVPTVTLD